MKKKVNFLDYIPRPNRLLEWKKKEDGKIEIKRQNKGIFHRLAQIIFKKPKYSYIELDEFGSFVWEQMDGTRSVYEIGLLVKMEFGEKAEPLYPRLARFIQVLHDQSFLVYVNKM